MKILLSPAKSLDYESQLPTENYTLPVFQQEAAILNKALKKLSVKKLVDLMSISDKLASLNVERNHNYSLEYTTINARPAVFAFAGDVYLGLNAYSLPISLHGELQDKVRILSGLYGYLRPLDLLQAYRLEMGTKLAVGKHNNLYEFWKGKITPQLNNEITDDEIVVTLASNEYFKVIDKKNLKGQLVTPIFKDHKNGKLKVISFFAKKARGTMARYLIENKSSSLQDILAFQEDDYRFSEEDTIHANQPVFVR